MNNLYEKKNIQKLEEDAKTRLRNYCHRFCMINLETLRSKEEIKNLNAKGLDSFDDNNDDRSKFVKLHKRFIDNANDHLICRTCVNNINLRDKEKKDSQGQMELKCNICNEKHYVSNKIWNTLCKSKDGGCCTKY